MRRYLFPVISGILGVAILLSLGFWQLRRMGWKEGMLAEIQAHIDSPEIPLPAAYQPEMKYAPVRLSGRTTGTEILALSGMQDRGAGYQVISGFVTDDGRKLLLDRGFIAQDDRRAARPPVDLVVRGNLHWPDERGSATPEPNLAENIWFAREVPRMAAHLGTEPLLVVASDVAGDAQGITPMPVSVEGIPNRHLEYAGTWFMLAMAWAGMTVGLIWRIRQRKF